MILKKVFIAFLLTLSIVEAGLFDFLKSMDIEKSYAKGDYNTTKELLRSLNTDNPKYNYNLANVYYKLGRYQEAIRYYKRAFGKGVDEHSRLHNLGNSYYQSKAYKNAIIAYRYALKLKEDPDTQHNLVLAQKALQRPKKQKEQEHKKQKEKRSKKPTKESKKRQKEARKLTKKEIKALDELKKRLHHKEELKNLLKKSFKGKKIPVIMYPLKINKKDKKEPW